MTTTQPTTLPAIGTRVYVLFGGREVPGVVTQHKSKTLFVVRTEFMPFVCSVKDVRLERAG